MRRIFVWFFVFGRKNVNVNNKKKEDVIKVMEAVLYLFSFLFGYNLQSMGVKAAQDVELYRGFSVNNEYSN